MDQSRSSVSQQTLNILSVGSYGHNKAVLTHHKLLLEKTCGFFSLSINPAQKTKTNQGRTRTCSRGFPLGAKDVFPSVPRERQISGTPRPGRSNPCSPTADHLDQNTPEPGSKQGGVSAAFREQAWTPLVQMTSLAHLA